MMTGEAASSVSLSRGNLFPWAALRDAPEVTFGYHTLGGRYLVLCFYGSAKDAVAQSALAAVRHHRALFDDDRICFFGMGRNPADKAEVRVADALPGIRFMDDRAGVAARICGALPQTAVPPDVTDASRAFWLVVDPTLHVLAHIPLSGEPGAHEAVFDLLRALPAGAAFAGFELPVPVLLLPNVFDRDSCRHLVGLYDSNGGIESGIYRGGAGVSDHAFKRRKDYTFDDPALIRRLQSTIARRIIPEIERLFFIRITRIDATSSVATRRRTTRILPT